MGKDKIMEHNTRVEQIKTYLERLSAGEELEKVRADFAKEFKEVADITGIILTKMDGTAKGGIAVAVQAELGIPVKYIGVGEKMEDLQRFDPDQFVKALFTPEEEDSEEE